jgi:flavin reductase (DIM6/NTAB) family NADH-FMN oxidoreductase RutF/DNA-binding IclR family transcriptional regulator
MTGPPAQAGVPALGGDRFRQVLGHFPTGVAAITASLADDAVAAMIVGSFVSISLDPPLVGFFASRDSKSFARVRQARSFCVNLLSADQHELSRVLASHNDDKFTGVPYRRSRSRSPIVDGVVGWIDCAVHASYEIGDHVLMIGRVEDLKIELPSAPLVFFRGGYGSFAAPSAAVPPETALIRQIRIAELARTEMDHVSADLDAECLAVAAVGDELVLVAAGSRPRSRSIKTRVGQRMPFVPPMGALFVAWAGNDAVEAWLSRAAAPLDPDRRRAYLEAVRRARSRGWSLGLGDDRHSQLEHLFGSTTREAILSDVGPDARQLIEGLASRYEPADLTPGVEYDVRNLSVPVFGVGGEVILLLTLYGLPPASRLADIERYRYRLLRAAEWLTHEISGVTPASE